MIRADLEMMGVYHRYRSFGRDDFLVRKCGEQQCSWKLMGEITGSHQMAQRQQRRRVLV